ncbi:MAG: two-component response regulator CseB [Frankiales bacterium]|jgi:two-component system phosphate regulon response regulator PhoB|nr:two-component response regulator CseB [Frankiales bacterium]
MALAAQQVPVHLVPASDFAGRALEVGVDVSGALVYGRLACDLDAYVVTRDGAEVDLSPRQVELLALFLAAPRRVWSREQLERVCWGDSSGSRRVDVQLCRLRARVGIDLLRNVRDRGWSLRSSI